MLLWIAIAACRTTVPEAGPVGEPPMRGVDLIVGVGPEAVTVHAAGAWVAPDGSGSGVGVTATVPGPPPLVVTGDRSTWRMADGVVVFEGSVVATRGDVVLRCDRLDVTYEGERVSRAHAEGTVRVQRGARTASGERADLTVADGRVVLEGSPVLSDGPNRLAGERIVLFLDDDRVECDRCRLEVAGEAVVPGR